jgi:hypothetical protein
VKHPDERLRGAKGGGQCSLCVDSVDLSRPIASPPVNRDLARAIALSLWVQERTSTRIEPFRWGRVFFNDGLRERYFSNFVRCEKLLAGVEVGRPASPAPWRGWRRVRA